MCLGKVMNYTSVKLKCAEELKIVTNEFLNQFDDGKDYYNYNLPVTDELRDKVNNEMAEYGLPKILNFLTFKRKNFLLDEADDPATMRGVHLDYFPAVKDINKSSIIIPISGCENTHMYYIDGDYEKEVLRMPAGNYYCKINWLGTAKIIDKLSLDDQPVLSRLEFPHTANSNKDGTYRCTLTMRFVDNLLFEEIYEKLNRHGCIAQR